MKVITIGGYGFTEDGFFRAVRDAGIQTFVDVRQRRGMRGARYAFLNSVRLQRALADMNVKYVHAPSLAPSTSIRDAQRNADLSAGDTKRSRAQLSAVFIERYRSEVLKSFDAAQLRDQLGGAATVGLFCVETEPSACHRSLAAEHLVELLGGERPVQHIQP
jgi:uncharacterized protein (DUF488 family)